MAVARLRLVPILLGAALVSLASVAAQFPGASEGAKPPNFIVIQPDDYYFFEEWTPPAHFDGRSSLKNFPPASNGLPNINRIRTGGLQLTSAYAAATMCGTSRYSTITGRYPSRSSYGRALDEHEELRDVRIPSTKLEDAWGVSDANDCSDHNIAALLQRNGYSTGVVGKWHLTSDDGGRYSYGKIRDDVRGCGFDFAEAIYKENIWGDWYGDVTHNMEHVTSRALQFIENAVTVDRKPFFLYFNPTVPHPSADVTDALRYADCRVTVEGTLDQSPFIPYGMTADYGGDCQSYRQSVLDRGGMYDDKMAGSVWVDDAIGSLFGTLESLGELDNTFILFQLDHGEAAKGTLFEPGSRIVQFVHYPDRISAGSSFDGLVSTIDIAATIAEVAGISQYGGAYPMDGKSWMSEVVSGNSGDGNQRCLFVEEGMDRSVRCGCYKYISIGNAQGSRTARGAREVGITVDTHNYYNLCDDATGSYITAPELSPERRSAGFDDSLKDSLKKKLQCHLRRTDPFNNPDYRNTVCDETLGFLSVQTTSSPTLRPTIQPSDRPTVQTSSPTHDPTPQPSSAPSTLQPSSASSTPKPSSAPSTPQPSSASSTLQPSSASSTPQPSSAPSTPQPSHSPTSLPPTPRPTGRPLPSYSFVTFAPTYLGVNYTGTGEYQEDDFIEDDYLYDETGSVVWDRVRLTRRSRPITDTADREFISSASDRDYRASSQNCFLLVVLYICVVIC